MIIITLKVMLLVFSVIFLLPSKVYAPLRGLSQEPAAIPIEWVDKKLEYKVPSQHESLDAGVPSGKKKYFRIPQKPVIRQKPSAKSGVNTLTKQDANFPWQPPGSDVI